MSFKLRYWTRFTKAFIFRFRGVLFASVIGGLLLFSVLRYFSPVIFNLKTEFVGKSGRYHTEELPSDIFKMIGEGLTAIDESGEVIPALAESWESDDDGRVWTFHLNSSKIWHDGTNVVAEDINYNFEDATVRKPDDKTIIFELSSPFSPFPVVVSRPVFKRGLLGTGEWRVLNIKLNNQYVEKLSVINSADVKRIFKFYPTEDAVKTAFKLGEIDIISDILDPRPFNDWRNVEIKKQVNEGRFVAMFFNNSADPFKQNKQLRQALSYAANKTDFGAPRATGPISPNSWGYNSQVKEYKYNVERANDILSEFPEGQLENLSFTLTTTPVLLATAEKLVNYWKQVGIEVNINVVSLIPDDYQAFLAIYNIPSDPDQYSIWHSTQTETNLSKLANPRIDLLLEDGRLELDAQERKKIYLDFQRYLLEDAPAIFLYHPISYTVVRK